MIGCFVYFLFLLKFTCSTNVEINWSYHDAATWWVFSRTYSTEKQKHSQSNLNSLEFYQKLDFYHGNSVILGGLHFFKLVLAVFRFYAVQIPSIFNWVAQLFPIEFFLKSTYQDSLWRHPPMTLINGLFSFRRRNQTHFLTFLCEIKKQLITRLHSVKGLV